MNNVEVKELIVSVLDDRKAEEIEVIELDERSSLAETFIICNGMSPLHVRSIADELRFKMEEAGVPLLHEEGSDTNRWILLDYGPSVVHIFHPEERQFYGLDKLWRRDRSN